MRRAKSVFYRESLEDFGNAEGRIGANYCITIAASLLAPRSTSKPGRRYRGESAALWAPRLAKPMILVQRLHLRVSSPGRGGSTQ